MADTLPVLAALARALREKLSRDAQLAAAEAALQRLFGHKVFTVMRYEAATDETERIYTNTPSFPRGGRKRRKTNDWNARVIDRGELHIGNSAAEIAAIFDDHAVIAAAGCAAILNIPVRHDGKTRGVLNLLHEAGHYATVDRDLALAVAGLMAPTLEA